eukprot:superscaffoldBa00001888_g12400
MVVTLTPSLFVLCAILSSLFSRLWQSWLQVGSQAPANSLSYPDTFMPTHILLFPPSPLHPSLPLSPPSPQSSAGCRRGQGRGPVKRGERGEQPLGSPSESLVTWAQTWPQLAPPPTILAFLSLSVMQTLIPLFDDDTGLLILAGVGDTVVDCFEVSASEPFLSQVSHCLTDVSTRGVAMVPKLALDVMSCEVMRVLQLTDSCIVPISYQVPRKNSGQEFHADLYPDTVGTTPAMSADEWWQGGNKQVEKVSLQPDKRPKPKAPPASKTPAKKELASGGSKEDPARGCSISSSPLSTPSSSAAPSRSPSSTSGLSSGFLPSPSPSQNAKTIQSLLGPTSKFRHIQGAVMHRDTHITNIRGLNLTTPGESDGFCVNRQRVAVPLAISGGQIAILERSQPGRLPDTAFPTIQNSVNVSDLCWDPFNTQRLAVAGDDAKIRVWQVPEGGLKETLTEPDLIMQGHLEKIYSIKYHPLASGLLVSSSYDLTVRLWNMESGEQVKLLSGHEDQVFGMAWSPDGKLLATVCKDGKVRIYDPRKSTSPVQEGPGPEGHRGARVVWVCEGKYLLVSGFDSRSERVLYLYSAESLSSGAIASTSVDVSPSTLIPFYDPDTSVVILTGKGDTRVHIYELVPETPYFVDCSSFNSPEPHKGLAFLPKTECNVRDVEIAMGLMLTKTTIEPVAFRVPRVKKEFFQDDVMTRGDVAFLCFSHGANDRGETSQSHSCVLCHPVVL